MDIYIVVYTGDGYRPKEKCRVYNDREDARLQAVDFASSSENILKNVLEVNTDSHRVTEFELAVELGQITLVKKRKEDN